MDGPVFIYVNIKSSNELIKDGWFEDEYGQFFKEDEISITVGMRDILGSKIEIEILDNTVRERIFDLDFYTYPLSIISNIDYAVLLIKEEIGLNPFYETQC